MDFEKIEKLGYEDIHSLYNNCIENNDTELLVRQQYLAGYITCVYGRTGFSNITGENPYTYCNSASWYTVPSSYSNSCSSNWFLDHDLAAKVCGYKSGINAASCATIYLTECEDL